MNIRCECGLTVLQSRYVVRYMFGVEFRRRCGHVWKKQFFIVHQIKDAGVLQVSFFKGLCLERCGFIREY